jgi:hypothetical protein
MKCGDVLDEIASLPYVIRLRVEHTSDPPQFPVTGDLVQIFAELLAFWAATSHPTFQWIVRPIGKREQLSSFIEPIEFVDICFEVN